MVRRSQRNGSGLMGIANVTVHPRKGDEPSLHFYTGDQTAGLELCGRLSPGSTVTILGMKNDPAFREYLRKLRTAIDMFFAEEER